MLKKLHNTKTGKKIITTLLSRYKQREGINLSQLRPQINGILKKQWSTDQDIVSQRKFNRIIRGETKDEDDFEYEAVYKALQLMSGSIGDEVLDVIFGMLPFYFGASDPEDVPTHTIAPEYCFFQRADVANPPQPFIVGKVSLRHVPDTAFFEANTHRIHRGKLPFVYKGIGFFDANGFFHIYCRGARVGDFIYCVLNNLDYSHSVTAASGVVIKKAAHRQIFFTPIAFTTIDKFPDDDTNGFVSEDLLPHFALESVGNSDLYPWTKFIR